jgi:hypothetical protein
MLDRPLRPFLPNRGGHAADYGRDRAKIAIAPLEMVNPMLSRTRHM